MKKIAMVITRAGVFLVSLSLVFLPTYSLAEKITEFKSARLIQGEKSFVNLINFPEGKEKESVLVRCKSWIKKNGKTFVPVCFIYDESHRIYEKAVLKYVHKARFEPARVNGKKKQVYLSFSVLFSWDGDSQMIRAYNHHFNNVEEFGLDYTAPQVYKFLTYGSCYKMQETKLKIFVDQYGKAIDGTILGAMKTIGACHRKSLKAYLTAKYIPAFHNEIAVNAKIIQASSSIGKIKGWCSDCGR